MRKFKVTEIFKLPDGTLVFAGDISSAGALPDGLETLIKGGPAKIITENQPAIDIVLEGEYLHNNPQNKQRALSTRTKLHLPISEIRKQSCFILIE
ncbi:MAG: hypothetical protein P1V97_28080 [Planctomycetota bacterium]|nr:hypothetical protein [Planctomycetota bacterium]